MRVILVDDEPPGRLALRQQLAGLPDAEIVAECGDGAAAVEAIMRHAPDVLFLDVQLGGVSGLDVLERVGADAVPAIVFVTAYDRYAVEAFEVAALDYVLKPLKRERLGETVRRVVTEVRDGKPSANATAIRTALDSPELQDQMPPLKRLPVRHRREVKLLDLSEVPIVFSRDRLVLARADGKEYLVDYTLQELEHRLPREQFVRVHRGALVNLDAIESYGGEDGVLVLRLKDGTRVEASERRAAEVRRRLR